MAVHDDFWKETEKAFERIQNKGVKSIDAEKPPNWFHPGQLRLWAAEKRYVLVLAGFQSGKTVSGPYWLMREIQRRGPGEYLMAGPSYSLLEKKAMKEMERVFCREYNLGEFKRNPIPRIEFHFKGMTKLFGSDEGDVTIFFGHAQNYESLESMTLKGAWLDEPGQEAFLEDSWDAIQRRLAVNQGRCLLTTTPYTASGSWLERRLYKPAEYGESEDVDYVPIKVLDNPNFPEAEYKRLMKEWPKWKSDMMLHGKFTRPFGAVYDCFDRNYHLVEPFDIPAHWPRYVGLDFGGANTAAICVAEDPQTTRWKAPDGEEVEGKRLYIYATYHEGSRTTEGHARAILEKARRYDGKVHACFGGSKSERQSRMDFSMAGLLVQEPRPSGFDSVSTGIQRVYRLVKRGELLFFDGMTRKLVDEMLGYSYKLDEDSQTPIGEIKNKSKFHRTDALRYVCGSLRFGDQTKVQVAGRYNRIGQGARV